MEPNTPLTNPPILALIIGINKYPHSDEWPDLSGAVGDADAFETFLKKNLNVSPSNITNLRDEEASRENILNAFLALRDNAKYKKDEAAIIIFYAGHGAEGDPPKEWGDWKTSTGKIEMLCPSDIGKEIDTEVDGERVETDAIPDRTISVLLNHISASRGNNITLIMDCCSSGGISRGVDVDGDPDMSIENYVPRLIKNPPPLRPLGDEKIWARGARGGTVPEGFADRFHESHVLLAACGREESAREDPRTKRGLFTSSLLKVLNNQDMPTLTYTSLMHRLKMPYWQTPHCEGYGVNRRLFNTTATGADPRFVLTKRDKGIITMEAGAAQGITVGSRFSVHETDLIDSLLTPNRSLGELEVKSINTFSSVMGPLSTAPNFKPPRLFYSKPTYAAEYTVKIFCADKALLGSAFPAAFNKKSGIIVVSDVQQCDLEIVVKDGKVHFDRHQQLVTEHLPTRIRHSVNVGDIATIQQVVVATRHFYYHLTRTSDDDFKNVWMEMKVLKEEFSRDFDLILTPMGNNLLAKEPATIVVDESVRLGMTIFNQTDLPLYPYLFYFDPTDLTIIDWYLTSIGAGAGALTTKVDVPLPPKSSLTIGYGEPGVVPWQFLLPEGEKKDLGFFKLFLSTRPAYFDSILQQESPFEPPSQGSKRGGKPTGTELSNQEKWGAKLATVIQVDKE